MTLLPALIRYDSVGFVSSLSCSIVCADGTVIVDLTLIFLSPESKLMVPWPCVAQLPVSRNSYILQEVIVNSFSVLSGSGETNLKNWMSLIANRLTVKGFMSGDFVSRLEESTNVVAKGLKEGKIRLDAAEMIVKTRFEDIPKTWAMVFEGKNRGKLVTEIIHEQ